MTLKVLWGSELFNLLFVRVIGNLSRFQTRPFSNVASMPSAKRNLWFKRGMMSSCSFGEITACPFLLFDFLLYLYHITKADRQWNNVKRTDESSLFLNIASPDESMQMKCINMPSLLPSHFIFFWLKRTFHMVKEVSHAHFRRQTTVSSSHLNSNKQHHTHSLHRFKEHL